MDTTLPELNLKNIILQDKYTPFAENEVNIIHKPNSHCIIRPEEIPIVIRWLKEKINQKDVKYTFIVSRGNINQHIEITKLLHQVREKLEEAGYLKIPFTFKQLSTIIAKHAEELKLTKFEVNELATVIKGYGDDTKVII